MRRNVAWNAQAMPASPDRAAKPIACMIFVAALGVAFWAGVLWVTMPLLH